MPHPNYFDDLKALINPWRSLGVLHTVHGAERIGHVPLKKWRRPRVPQIIYLHGLFPPLSSEQIAELESIVGRRIPASLKELYLCTNGITLFSGHLTIRGLRTSLALEDQGNWSFPFHLADHNRYDRVIGIPDNWLAIGRFYTDTSQLYIDDETEQIIRTSQSGVQPLNIWPDLGTMLVNEFKRLRTFFDDRGRIIDPDVNTAPEPDSSL